MYIQTSPQAECPSLLYKNQWVQLASATINDKYQPHSKGGIRLHFFTICDLTKGYPFKYSMIRENLLQVSDRSHCLSSNLNSQQAAKCWLQLRIFPRCNIHPEAILSFKCEWKLYALTILCALDTLPSLALRNLTSVSVRYPWYTFCTKFETSYTYGHNIVIGSRNITNKDLYFYSSKPLINIEQWNSQAFIQYLTIAHAKMLSSSYFVQPLH